MPKQYNQGSNSRHQSMPLLQKNSESKKKCKTLPVQVELNQIQTAPKHSSRVKIQNLKLCSIWPEQLHAAKKQPAWDKVKNSNANTLGSHSLLLK
jgi:hypothetical protein